MTELKIVATIVVKSEFEKDVLTALHNIIPPTRKEEGCVSYELHQNITNPLEYTFLEVWKSQEAIDIHMDSDHLNEFKQTLDGKIDSLTVNIIKKIA